MVAILETIARDHPALEVHYVHGTLDGATHAMGAHIGALAASHPNIRTTTFYQEPRPQDVPGQTFDTAGMIDADWLRDNTPIATAHYFLCGPRPFLRAFVSALSLEGVPADRIHYEFFGPADEMLAA